MLRSHHTSDSASDRKRHSFPEADETCSGAKLAEVASRRGGIAVPLREIF